VYALTESGPDHHKRFHATVAVGGERLGAGTGTSKKEAEQKAARAAYERRSAQDGVRDDV
jgi:ribonuclease-3